MPTWDRPPPRQRKIIQRELEQVALKQREEEREEEEAAAPVKPVITTAARNADAIERAQALIGEFDPERVTKNHQLWFKKASAEQDSESQTRVSKIALGEQAMFCKMANFELQTRVPMMIRAPWLPMGGRSTTAYARTPPHPDQPASDRLLSAHIMCTLHAVCWSHLRN